MTKHEPSVVQLVAAQRALLIERLSGFLAPLHPVLRADMTRALQGEGKLLYQVPIASELSQPQPLAGMWALVTFLIACYVAPDVDPIFAANVAIAVECFVCATDLLDDVADGDQTTTLLALGEPRALNVSTGLLTLAHQAILSSFQQGIETRLILRLLDTLEALTLAAVSGQHRDIVSEQQSMRVCTREECLEIAAAKAGSIVRLAFQLGALCAGADDALCQQLSSAGELLGIAHQLDNDAHDLYNALQEAPYDDNAGGAGIDGTSRAEPPPLLVKSDLARGKKTLPVVLAARSDETLQRFSELTDEEKQEHLPAFQEAIMTSWGMALLYRERVRERLQELEARKPVTPALCMLLGLT
jgi:geranylgeranyl pyrophosphate synthase